MRNVQIICQKINDIYIDFNQNLKLSLLMHNLRQILPFLKSVCYIEYIKNNNNILLIEEILS